MKRRKKKADGGDLLCVFGACWVERALGVHLQELISARPCCSCSSCSPPCSNAACCSQTRGVKLTAQPRAFGILQARGTARVRAPSRINENFSVLPLLCHRGTLQKPAKKPNAATREHRLHATWLFRGLLPSEPVSYLHSKKPACFALCKITARCVWQEAAVLWLWEAGRMLQMKL